MTIDDAKVGHAGVPSVVIRFIKMSSINIDMTIDDMPTWRTPACPPLTSDL